MTNTVRESPVTGEYVTLDDERYFCITNSHQMPDFFMSLVGADDHWMFVSSSGALTAGRRNPDLALFPYAADDQISIAQSVTGPTTLIRDEDGTVWEPFARKTVALPHIRRNLYKTPLGNKLVFEEINEQQQLAFRYRWTFSEKFGFIRTCKLETRGGSRQLTLLDGLLNVLPFGVGSEFMMRFSNLANAYKKNELLSDSGLGLYYLSSIPTDRAEPSEGLKATSVWQTGLSPNATLLSAEQLPAFRGGQIPSTEIDVRGKAGAYLVTQPIELDSKAPIEWSIVAELAQDHADIIQLDDWLRTPSNRAEAVAEDIKISEQKFLHIVSSSDGLQCSQNNRRAYRHLSNTVFNVMRGGIPLENYDVSRDDFLDYAKNFNRPAFTQHQNTLRALPEQLPLSDLQNEVKKCESLDLSRLAMEYLPLAFSRRHGDPTRPWNRFSIDLTGEDGSTNLNYQGNWRDIFQNWEALAFSFPQFTTAMICRFANATTADGYNPYRLTKDGFEWEEPTPEDPWANIGYWGDHQIIYLLKLLEWSRRLSPNDLDQLLNNPTFAHANIPYRIKPFSEIKKDAQDTIEFDHERSAGINQRVSNMGADGKLLTDAQGNIHYVTLLEKLLALSLAKLSNFIPDGGIWLNTQRPEWNDANNALVGNGLSMVTTCYLYRWFTFIETWIAGSSEETFNVSAEVANFFADISKVLQANASSLQAELDPLTRQQVVEELSLAGSKFRTLLYDEGFSGATTALSREACIELLQHSRLALESTIKNNKRSDGLYHAYNLIVCPPGSDWKQEGVLVDHLYEMLEGQVAVLSSGLLSATEVNELLDALRISSLYRENQNSYLLYPDRRLPRFLQKNNIPQEAIIDNPLVKQLLDDGDARIVKRDINGEVHYNGNFRNSTDLRAALAQLAPSYQPNVTAHGEALCQTFDDIFHHRQFTGRSGTFFAYEGLGSIYWHMVSKLGIAVSENLFWALDKNAPRQVIDSLRNHAASIRDGIGCEKSPTEYGAFPTDPYSHTPENAGVKQPGMTGQVKEDILARFAELGLHIENGCVQFRLDQFDTSELLSAPNEFEYFHTLGTRQSIQVPANSLAFTFCQVPIVYLAADQNSIRVRHTNGTETNVVGTQLGEDLSQTLFRRTGEIQSIEFHFTSR